MARSGSVRWPPSPRALHIGFLALAALVILTSLTWRPRVLGDGFEYIVTLEAWFRHASPDIRSGDLEAVSAILGNEVVPEAARANCLVLAPGGARYVLHFWLYSLLGVPARALLPVIGVPPLAALQVTNVVMACAALYFVLFATRLPLFVRLTLTGLATVSPVYWYMKWPHPEVLCWSLALIACAALLEDRFALAAASAAIAATQNPPLVLLSALAVLLALARGGWRTAVTTGVASLPAALAPMFYLKVFGGGSPLFRVGAVDTTKVSLSRTWSFLTDPNIGLLPWAPGLLLLALAGLLWSLARRDARVPLLAATLLAMIKLTEVTANWNAGAAGLIRYAVWMLPLLAAMAASGLPRGRAGNRAVAAGLVLQAFIVSGHGWRTGYVRPTALATWLLAEHPRWYNPDPEIFAERQFGAEHPWHAVLPIDFAHADGIVTKILLSPETCRNLRDCYDGDELYLADAEAECRRRERPFYLNPPRGVLYRRAR